MHKTIAAISLMVAFGLAAAPTATAEPPWRNCQEAHSDYAYNIQRTDWGYDPALDSDGDGFACEAHW